MPPVVSWPGSLQFIIFLEKTFEFVNIIIKGRLLTHADLPLPLDHLFPKRLAELVAGFTACSEKPEALL